MRLYKHRWRKERRVNKHNVILKNTDVPRIAYLAGGINSTSVKRLIRQLNRFQAQSASLPVNLMINSGGGNLCDALTLYDFIDKIATIPVHAIVVGECSSVALLVLLACEKRASTRYARFRIYGSISARISFRNGVTSKQVEQLLLEIGRIKAEMIHIFELKLGLPREQIRELLEKGEAEFDNIQNAFQAKRLGLLQKIVHEKLEAIPQPLQAITA